jgi:uncharacterized membrane protein
MSIIGQPESYSDILKRIFWVTLGTGVICTSILSTISPDVHALLAPLDAEIKIGPIEKVKASLVLIPFLVALISRALVLHDKISDFLHIRARFDVEYLLKPLVNGVGLSLSEQESKVLEVRRTAAMRKMFYPFASFKDPKIDAQTVITAADHWGWFWCTVEPQVILGIFAIFCTIMQAWLYVAATLFVIAVMLFGAAHFWREAKNSAKAQVAEILSERTRREHILATFPEVMGAI